MLAAVLLFATLGAHAPVRAQEVPLWLNRTAVRDPAAWAGTDAEGELLFAGASAVLGGLTAGIAQAVRGEPFWPAFLRGGAGGAVAYGGRRLGAERFSGAGLLGREVAAVGASVVANAAAGRAPLARLTLPVGPVDLLVRRDGGRVLQPRLNAWAAAWTLHGTLDGDYVLDLPATLSRGAAVFRRQPDAPASAGASRVGGSIGGVIFMEERAALGPGRVLVHEWSHVVQTDYLAISLGAPLEEAAGVWAPERGGVRGWARPGLAVPVGRWVLGQLLREGPGWRPVEIEAAFLESRVPRR